MAIMPCLPERDKMFTTIRIVIIAVIITVLSFSASAFAQGRKIVGYVEYNHTIRDATDAHQINEYAQISWAGKKVGVSTFALVMEGFGEAYIGPTYQATDWLSVSGGIGIESGRPSFRKAGSVWLGKGHVSFLSIQEKGSGHWQKNVGKVEILKGLTIGILQQTYVGAGPYVELSHRKVTFWGSYAPTEKRGLIAIRVGL